MFFSNLIKYIFIKHLLDITYLHIYDVHFKKIM